MKKQSEPTDGSEHRSDASAPERAVQQAVKTPLFEANHSDRYQRQALIRQIQESTKRVLLCFVSGEERGIDPDDTLPFVDLLHKVPSERDLDLLLHTTGGSVDAAEKLMGLMRRKVGTASLRIIVPDFAKSAGTVMVLGADSVVMSDMSELGPIDPQTIISGRWQSVQNYLDAYAEYSSMLTIDPDNVVARIMLGKLDPATIKAFEAARERARQAAENLLKRGMFRREGNWSKTVSELLDTTRWKSHGQMISWEDARDPQIGLNVTHLSYHSETWQRYWRLACLQRLAVGSHQKLYESDYVSLIVDPPS